MVTYTATNDGAVDTDFTYEDYPGLSKKVYNDLKKDINGLQSKYSTLLTTDTPENRKYFLYGCGLHIITDAFAHSTTKKTELLLDTAIITEHIQTRPAIITDAIRQQ